MKLTELKPKWIESQWDVLNSVVFGVSFQCPHCQSVRLAIFFTEPFGETNKINTAQWADPRKSDTVEILLWNRQGETFDDLTISPSIDASKRGHWHGFIQNGTVAP